MCSYPATLAARHANPCPRRDRIKGVRSTAHAKTGVRRLDPNLAFVLRARNKPECTSSRLKGDSAVILLVWIVHELIELDHRRGSHVESRLVEKLKVRLPDGAGPNRLAFVNIASRLKGPCDGAICLGFHAARLPDGGLGVGGRGLQCQQGLPQK